MKQYLLVVVIAMMFFANLAQAQDVKVAIGVNSWVNKWKITFKKDSIESDNSIMMVGPTLSIRYDKVFGGISFLTSMADYEFSTSYMVEGIPMKLSILSSRKDLDLTGGFMFTPRFGAFLGYKTTKGNGKVSLEIPYVGKVEENFSTKSKGPGFGIKGNIPIGETGTLYGSLAWMSLKDDEDEEPVESSGVSFECGGVFKLTDQLYANVGLKAQSFKEKKDGGESEFSGLTAGINYTF